MEGCCECGEELSGSIKCGKFLSCLVYVSFSGRTLFHGVSLFSCLNVVLVFVN